MRREQMMCRLVGVPESGGLEGWPSPCFRRLYQNAAHRARGDLAHLQLRGPHDLRHSFSTWLEDAGIPARVIDEVMGHEGTSRAGQQRGSAMGAHYRHTTPEMAARIARAEGEDALCLVELRGFEPLTPCMPCHPHQFTTPFHACPAPHQPCFKEMAGQGAVVRREGTCGIAADNLLTGGRRLPSLVLDAIVRCVLLTRYGVGRAGGSGWNTWRS